MARAIDKRIMLDLIIEAKKTDPGTGPFSEWLAEYLVDHLPTLTPPNEPLTLEQLREMGGQPVYMPDTNCWALVTQNAFCPILTFPDGEKCSVYDWYEQVGPVYRRPPEAKDNNVPTNEPLTIEELREMDGDPVWIVDVGPHKWYGPGWAIVDRDNCLVRTAKNWNPVFFERYGERWIAYRCPPEGEA